MPTTKKRQIEILTRRLRNRVAFCTSAMSPESQLAEVEALVEDLRQRREGADDDEAAKIANVEVNAHRLLALLREQAEKSKPPPGKLDALTDDELEAKRLHLVRELCK